MSNTSSTRLPRLTQKLATLVPVMWYGFFVALLVASWPHTALAQLACTISQITNTSDFTYGPGINAAGNRIAFTSDGNLTGANPDRNRELFLYNATTCTLTQFTNTGAETISERPALNADGTRIAFHSFADLTGGNPEGNFETFLFNTTTNTFTQISSGGVGLDSLFPAINANGSRIAFESRADLTGDNPDNSLEIFLFDTTANTLRQITDATGPLAFNARVSINGDGTRLVFYSFADLTGTGTNSDGNGEIFLFDTTTNSFTQITDTIGPGTGQDANTFPSIDASGTRIAFTSNRDLTGQNAGDQASDEIFLFDTTTNAFTQITNTPAGGGSSSPSISADGTRIVFASSMDGGGLFLFDTTTNAFSQVALAGGGEPTPTNSDGSRVTYASGNIFVASCGAPVPVVTARANNPNIVEVGLPLGTFTITRSGDFIKGEIDPLPVNFTLGGTATEGTDYTTVGTSVTIPACRSSGFVSIRPIADTLPEGTETAILTLESGADYTVGSPGTATVNIANYSGGVLRGQQRVAFGNVRLGSSLNRDAIISNGSTTQSLVVTINNPTPNPPFSLVSGGGTVVLGPGQVLSVTVRFSPTVAGNATGTLQINSTDPARPTSNVQLTGSSK